MEKYGEIQRNTQSYVVIHTLYQTYQHSYQQMCIIHSLEKNQLICIKICIIIRKILKFIVFEVKASYTIDYIIVSSIGFFSRICSV